MNPITHKALAYSGSDTHLHDLAVPGEDDTGTEAVTGSVRIFLGAGQRHVGDPHGTACRFRPWNPR